MVFVAIVIGGIGCIVFPIYLGRASALRSFRIFVPTKGSYWRHKEKGFIIRVDDTACDVWYGRVVGKENLYPGCMSVKGFYKTFKKMKKNEVEEELAREEGIRALAAL